jgi:thiamine biosynthesis lipoprotein
MTAVEVQTFPFEAMGSPCAVHVDADDELADQAVREAIREVHRIEAKYSRYLPSSLLSAINRQASLGAAIELDEETAALIDYAAQCHRLSGGLFDITSGVLRKAWDFRVRATPDLERLPRLLEVVGSGKLKWSRPTLGFAVPGMEIDFGGIAKEYAVDRAVQICLGRGVSACLVDLGGDVGVGGPHRDASPWPIAIRSGGAGSNVAFATIALSGGALATSGDYERFIEFEGRRYSHILNPKTGWPVSGLASVSVAADRCLAAGACSTIAMLKGEAGARWLADRSIAHAWIDQDGRRFATPPFELID